MFLGQIFLRNVMIDLIWLLTWVAQDVLSRKAMSKEVTCTVKLSTRSSLALAVV